MNLVPFCDSPTVNIVWAMKYKVASHFEVKSDDMELTFFM